VQEYAKRFSHYVRFALLELPASRRKEKDAAQAEEAQALLGKKSERDWLIVLDERGELLDSRGLAQLVGEAQAAGRDLLVAIGGDEGHSDEVRRAAKKVVSLSRMTLPHRLARAVIAEQLYRAFTILRGEPYHK
jgi:23S rRNA (pseudouridine1915-N3)-methyltransferase